MEAMVASTSACRCTCIRLCLMSKMGIKHHKFPSCHSTVTACLQVGDWETCSESCGSGLKNRTVSCVEHDGTVVADKYCTGLEPEHQAYCNDYPCDFCSTTDCSSEVMGIHTMVQS